MENTIGWLNFKSFQYEVRNLFCQNDAIIKLIFLAAFLLTHWFKDKVQCN